MTRRTIQARRAAAEVRARHERLADAAMKARADAPVASVEARGDGSPPVEVDTRSLEAPRRPGLRLLPVPLRSDAPPALGAQRPYTLRRATVDRDVPASWAHTQPTRALDRLDERLDHLATCLDELGATNAGARVRRTRLVMLLPALVADRGDLDGAVQGFWAHRVSRAALAGPRGEIRGRAPDESLRSEAASFWVVADVPRSARALLRGTPLEDQLAVLLHAKLARLASGLEGAFAGRSLRVLFWRGDRPHHLEVPLELLGRPAAAATAALSEVLRRLADPRTAPPTVALGRGGVAQLAAEAYGSYDRQSAVTAKILDADLALVLDPIRAEGDTIVDRLFAPGTTALTGGARMKEVTTVFLDRRTDTPVIETVATRFAHAWVDGLEATERLHADLAALADPARRPARGEVTRASRLELSGVSTSEVERAPTWCRAIALGDRAVHLPEEWSGARTISGDLVGWSGAQKDSDRSWTARISRLRDTHDGLKITLGDVYAKAHMFAAGTLDVHTLVSRGQGTARSLDVAFDLLPSAALDTFERFLAFAARRGVRSAADVAPPRIAAFERAHPGLLRTIGEALTRGARRFHAEKERAREGSSTTAFFSALARGDRRIEGLFAEVSRLDVLLGETLTQAIAHPSGMVSNTTSSRGVPRASAPDAPNPRAFFTATSDAYRPLGPKERTRRWAGVLGIGERPGEGHVLTLRLLPDQVAGEIERAVRSLALDTDEEPRVLTALARSLDVRHRDASDLTTELQRAGASTRAPDVIEAIDRAVKAHIARQLLRTELAVELILAALESSVQNGPGSKTGGTRQGS